MRFFDFMAGRKKRKYENHDLSNRCGDSVLVGELDVIAMIISRWIERDLCKKAVPPSPEDTGSKHNMLIV